MRARIESAIIRRERHRLAKCGLRIGVVQLERERIPFCDLGVDIARVGCKRFLGFVERLGGAAPKQMRLRRARMTLGSASIQILHDTALHHRRTEIAFRDRRTCQLDVKIDCRLPASPVEQIRAATKLVGRLVQMASASKRPPIAHRCMRIIRCRLRRGLERGQRRLLRRRADRPKEGRASYETA